MTFAAVVLRLARRTYGLIDYKFCFQVMTPDKLFTHVCLCHYAVKSGTGQMLVMLCGWEYNCRNC